MDFRKILAIVAVSSASVAFAAGFEAGKGVANDLATGANQRDVTFVERGGNNSYGWQSYDIVLGVTVLPWSIPNEESSVYGLRLNFGWGAYVDTYGLQIAFVNVAEDLHGVQIGVLNFNNSGLKCFPIINIGF